MRKRTIHLPDDLYEYVVKVANEHGLSFSDAVCAILEEMKSNGP